MISLDKIIGKIAIPTIAVAGLLLIIMFASSGRKTNNETNGYISVINCIISIPPMTRTQDDIDNCYKTVEKDLGEKLRRYDDSKK